MRLIDIEIVSRTGSTIGLRAFPCPTFRRDTDDGDMIPRYVAAMLGLLAFTVTISGGLYAQNPIGLTLERGMVALFLFCLLGFMIGWAAQLVMREYEQNRESEIMKRFERSVNDKDVESDGATGSVPDGGLTGA